MTYTPRHDIDSPFIADSIDSEIIAHMSARESALVRLRKELNTREAFIELDQDDTRIGRHCAPERFAQHRYNHRQYIRVLDDNSPHGYRIVRYVPRPKLRLPVTTIFGFDFLIDD